MDPQLFREVLGQYPTGVVVVTAQGADGPVGMTVGSFSSVSLDPPLVAFMPDKKSSSWQSLQQSGTSFCVNVLGAHQEEICRTVATRKDQKFKDIPWHESTHGPIIDGAVVQLQCVREAIYDGGDHDIVVGRVVDLGIQNAAYPLLFFRGGYGSFKPSSLAAIEVGLIDHLRSADLARPHMERLADQFSTEVTASVLIGDELILTASVGRTDAKKVPTRVGLRIPFMAPAGGVFAAWGGDETRRRWLDVVGSEVSNEMAAEFEGVPERVRQRGYAVTFGEDYLEFETVASGMAEGDLQASAGLRERMLKLADDYNPAEIDLSGGRRLRVVSAPVFSDDDTVAFQLTIWGPEREVSSAEFESYVEALKVEAARASRSMVGSS